MSRSQHNDDKLVAIFKNIAVKNDLKSAEQGRPIYDDVEHVEIRKAGSRDYGVYPALVQSHWGIDPISGEMSIITYAERFERQYRQFKMLQNQTKTGTPLQYVPFMTEARRAELRALNIYTVEQLAAIDGQELKNIGQGGRDLKLKAEEYIIEAKVRAPDTNMIAEMDALKARNAVLEEDVKALKTPAPADVAGGKLDVDFDEMTVEQLRELITTNSGREPVGNLSRKLLVAMAKDSQKALA